MDSIKNFFKWVVSGLEHMLTDGAKIVVEYGGEFAEAVAQNGGPVLIALAKAGVEAAQKTDSTGSEKMEMVKNSVATNLKSDWPNLAIGIVKTVIENEVAKMNAAKAA